MKKLLFTMCLSFTPMFSNAGTIVCGGTVEEVSYHTPGGFMLRLSSMNNVVMFCSTETSWQPPGVSTSISADTCKQLYSTFLTARITGQPLNNVYFDGDEVPETCDSWGSWKKTTIRHYRF